MDENRSGKLPPVVTIWMFSTACFLIFFLIATGMLVYQGAYGVAALFGLMTLVLVGCLFVLNRVRFR